MAEFNQAAALSDYTELSRRIAVGAYTERSAEDFEAGTYPEDGIEESIDNLTELAAEQGLEFSWDEQNGYSLIPMTEETRAARMQVVNPLDTFPVEEDLDDDAYMEESE